MRANLVAYVKCPNCKVIWKLGQNNEINTRCLDCKEDYNVNKNVFLHQDTSVEILQAILNMKN